METEEKSGPDVAAVKRLVASHDKLTEEIATAESKLASLKSKRSDVVSELSTALNGQPLKIRGQNVMIVNRGDTWTLRMPREKTGGVEI